jgi:hypothetical protein
MQQQLTEDKSHDLPKQNKPILDRIDNFYLAFLGVFFIPTCVSGIFIPIISSIVQFIGSFLSKNFILFSTPVSILLALVIGAWLAGMILGTWMPKNIKKAIKWFYGLAVIPFYVFYIFPQLQSLWTEHQNGENSIFRLIINLLLPLFFYPTLFLGVYKGASWASKKRLKKLEKSQTP